MRRGKGEDYAKKYVASTTCGSPFLPPICLAAPSWNVNGFMLDKLTLLCCNALHQISCVSHKLACLLQPSLTHLVSLLRRNTTFWQFISSCLYSFFYVICMLGSHARLVHQWYNIQLPRKGRIEFRLLKVSYNSAIWKEHCKRKLLQHCLARCLGWDSSSGRGLKWRFRFIHE